MLLVSFENMCALHFESARLARSMIACAYKNKPQTMSHVLWENCYARRKMLEFFFISQMSYCFITFSNAPDPAPWEKKRGSESTALSAKRIAGQVVLPEAFGGITANIAAFGKIRKTWVFPKLTVTTHGRKCHRYPYCTLIRTSHAIWPISSLIINS